MKFSIKDKFSSETLTLIKQSILKTISWRILSTILTVLVILIGTGSLDLAVKLGMLDTAIKSVVFFIHEIWLEKRFSEKNHK